MKNCLILGGLLLLFGGLSLATSYVTQKHLAIVPRMTCDQLERNGPPADGQVTLTDVVPCSRGSVAMRSDLDVDVYVPAYPAGLGQEPDPPSLGFLLQIYGDQVRQPLLEVSGPVEITCWAHRGAHVVDMRRRPGEIERGGREGLEKKYPGIRLNDVWVLTIGHGSTPTAELVRSAWLYGVVEFIIGTALLGTGGVLARKHLGRQGAQSDNALAKKVLYNAAPGGLESTVHWPAVIIP